MNEVTLNDFNSYFKEAIYNSTVKYEQLRITARITAYIIMPIIITALCTSIVFITNAQAQNTELIAICMGLFGLLISYLLVAELIKKAYTNKIKKEILPKVLKFINMKVGDKKSISHELKNLAKSLKILPRFSNCQCDDYITGEYNGSKLKIYDIILTKQERHGKKSRTVTVFKGALACLSNPREQKAEIVINVPYSSSSLEQIKVDDQEFNYDYSVYSNNPNEAKNFLTSEVINKFIKETKTNGKVYFSFEQNLINLKISSSIDLFEVSFDKSPSDITNYIRIINEIETIYEKLDFIISLSNIK